MSEVVIGGVRYLPEPQRRCKKATIGDLAHDARKRKGDTLEEAAENMAISKSHLWAIEKGSTTDPGLGVVLSLVHYYGLDFNQISTPTVRA